MTDSDDLLVITDLTISAASRHDTREYVRALSFSIGRGDSVALVGESGSGKSLTVKSILGLLPRGLRATGSVRGIRGDVLSLSPRELQQFRVRDVAIIHQDPRLSTDPLQTIGAFLIEGPVAAHQMSRVDATRRAEELLREMGIPDAERRMAQYPHELSGGLLQRVMIAMALMSRPTLILADEPTTALDVTVQSEVMAILLEQVHREGASLLFVTHDLDLAVAVTRQVIVMYAGSIVEVGDSASIHDRPAHPYTAGLLQSRPDPTSRRRLRPIPGRPVSAHEVPVGCSFADRCEFAIEICRTTRPELRALGDRQVACHRAEELDGRLLEEKR